MEIPIMSRISGFESSINPLQNPSLISRIFQLSGIDQIPEFYTFWTWGALILAAIATLTSLTNRPNLVFSRLPKGNSVISPPLLRFSNEDDTCSSSSEDDDDCHELTSENFLVANSSKFDEYQGQIGKLKRWQQLSAGNGSVVKLWDGLGLGFENSNGYISMWDLNRGKIIRSFITGQGQIPAICLKSPAVVLSAGVGNIGKVALRVWDSRVGGQIPATVAEWKPRRREIVGIDSGGVEKVYVRDDVRSEVVVRDLRNMRAPLEGLTESDVQTWFDADAVIVGDGDEDFDDVTTLGLAENGCGSDSVVSRCRNAVKSYLF
ncbi:uncharacterized protein LOC143882690 [Tasmannia lanceolata]|uniref:uncharacterized protein LOC143882690 n=1 Tax=Tasmannia lanceolata TaxID=3420 RepID=UPI00406381CC